MYEEWRRKQWKEVSSIDYIVGINVLPSMFLVPHIKELHGIVFKLHLHQHMSYFINVTE